MEQIETLRDVTEKGFRSLYQALSERDKEVKVLEKKIDEVVSWTTKQESFLEGDGRLGSASERLLRAELMLEQRNHEIKELQEKNSNLWRAVWGIVSGIIVGVTIVWLTGALGQ